MRVRPIESRDDRLRHESGKSTVYVIVSSFNGNASLCEGAFCKASDPLGGVSLYAN